MTIEKRCVCDDMGVTPWRNDKSWFCKELGAKMNTKLFGALMALFVMLMAGAFGFSWATYARVSVLETSMIKSMSEVTEKIMSEVSKNKTQIEINKDRLRREFRSNNPTSH